MVYPGVGGWEEYRLRVQALSVICWLYDFGKIKLFDFTFLLQ